VGGTPEVIPAGMAAASIIADVIDRLHTRTDPLIEPVAISRYQSLLEVAALGWQSSPIRRHQYEATPVTTGA
jgi:hypothetical protein